MLICQMRDNGIQTLHCPSINYVIGEKDFMQLDHCLSKFSISLFTDCSGRPLFCHPVEEPCNINENCLISDLNTGTYPTSINNKLVHRP
jgi:hypothetical protein